MTKIRLINKEAFLGTVFIFLFMWLLQASNIQVELINVFEQVFENFELTDVYYQTKKSIIQSFEDEIVIVNIGNLDRKDLYKFYVFQKVNQAMGIDATFVGPWPKILEILCL